jgi:hypothetical protein
MVLIILPPLLSQHFNLNNWCPVAFHTAYNWRSYVLFLDLSYGKENVPISCVNSIDKNYPEYLEYSTVRIPKDKVGVNLLMNGTGTWYNLLLLFEGIYQHRWGVPYRLWLYRWLSGQRKVSDGQCSRSCFGFVGPDNVWPLGSVFLIFFFHEVPVLW